jgi:hypothetical protein
MNRFRLIFASFHRLKKVELKLNGGQFNFSNFDKVEESFGNNIVDSPKPTNYNEKDNIVPIWTRQKSNG